MKDEGDEDETTVLPDSTFENAVEEEDEDEEEEEEEGEEDEIEPLPPPPEEDKELIFLIEFLVDTLTIYPENMATEGLDPCALQGPASVTLTFLHFPPMMICETDIDTGKMTGSNYVQFNAGKSLTFALTESQFEEPPPVYLAVTATKAMPHAFRFPELLIGRTKIQLSELFKQLFDKYDETREKCPGKTVSKSIKDKYELVGDKIKPAGDVSIYIRLTCMGENIITEFQKADDVPDAILFKSKESKKVYECRETDVVEAEPARTIGDKMKKSCVPKPIPPPPDPADENLEQIFAEINGTAIRIDFEKSDRKRPPRQFHVTEFCDCDIPLPEDLVSGMSELSLTPQIQPNVELGKEEKQVIDRRVGKDPANRLLFPIPPTEVLAQPEALQNNVVYNVKTCNDPEHNHHGKGTYKIVTDHNPDGEPPYLPNCPEKDVFILRIIKRGRKEKGKDNLELELKIPKEKIEPPLKIPYMKERGVGPEKGKPKGGKKKR